MDYSPGVSQMHMLLSLVFTGEEPAMSKTTPLLNVKQRRELVDAGLIELEKRGRAFHVILTDKGWAWAFDAFHQKVPSRLKLNARALEGLLRRLATHMKKNRVALADLLGCDDPEPHALEPARPEFLDTKKLEARVCSAYYCLAGNQWNVRVTIKALRKFLSDIETDDLSALLCRMQQSNDTTLVLYPYDDPREITPEDAAAAVHTGGRENHIVYMGE